MNRFSKLFFTDGLGSKFATNSCLNIASRLKHVATLHCEAWKSEKWRQSEICIVINDKSQGSIAKHLRSDELLYYTFIILSAGKRIYKIGEHLAKLQAKWLIVSCAPFALHFCHQRCWSRQIGWITCVLRQKLLLIVVTLTGRWMWVYYQQISNCCRPVLTYWPTDWRYQWLTDYWSCRAFCCDSFSLLWRLCTVGHGFFYTADVKNFLLVN